jgi:CRP-like cAMP-binding protein
LIALKIQKYCRYKEQKWKRCMIEVPRLERFFRLLIQKAYIASTDRIYSNLSKPAHERYQEFIEKYPQIEQRVPNHQIASFLGITPQSLSRIRSQSVSRKKAGSSKV